MAIVVGTNGNDDLDGTANNDLIIAGNGNDTIDGGDGHDLIFAGRGDDTIDGGAGNDVIVAGSGDDTVDGGDGHDLIFGGRGDDTIMGGDGNDLIFGGSGDDMIDGGEGCDIISAGKGDDLVIFDVDQNAGAQNYFSGGSGNDTLRLRLTQSQFNEMTAAGVFAAFASHVGSHSGFDFSTFGLSFPINLKVWYFEQIDIEITGSPGLFTNGDDTVDFNSVVAGTYQDGTQYDGLDGNDTVTLADTAAAAATAGFAVGTAFNAGAGDDTVNGGALDDIINGDAGNDVLNGGTGVDVLNGGDDDDRLILEDINVGDSVDGGDGNDTFVFAAANGSDHRIEVRPFEVEYDVTTTISVINVEAYELTLADGNDVVLISTAFASNDIINGLAGNDNLIAGTGLDMVFGGDGNDSITLNDATAGDSVDGGADTDTFIYREFLNINNTITVNLADVTVDGIAISYTNIETVDINAGAGNDNITGSANNDTLRGQADDDTINGGGGNDIIQGGTGLDMLFGDGGNDILSLNDATAGDSVDGGADFDTFNYIADTNANVITINPGDVTVDGIAITVSNIESIDINAGAGNDIVTGGAGNEILRGLADDDTLDGGTGSDNLQGGAGNDRLILGDVNLGDNVDGGADTDTLVYVATNGSNHTITGTATNLTVDGVTIPVTNVENFEITGGDQDDTITTHDGDDIINGGTGNETIDAGDGDDRVSVDDDLDLLETIDGGAGTDTFVHTLSDGVNHVATLTASAFNLDGDAFAVSNFENFEGTGGDGNDVINENTGGDSILRGGDGNDSLSATTGVDQLFGDAGNDNLDFWDANVGDSADGGAGSDTFLFREVGANNNNVITVANGNTGVTVDGTTISLTDIERVRIQGLEGDDDITGGDQGDILNGGVGDDTLRGGDGNDLLLATNGLDALFGDGGNDTLEFYDVDAGDSVDGGAGVDTFTFREIGASNNNTVTIANGNASVTVDGVVLTLTDIERVNIDSRDGNDTITGGDQDDSLSGGAGNDIIDGGDGADFVDGGLGVDALQGGAGNDQLLMSDANTSDSADGGLGTDTFTFRENASSNNNVITIANANAGVTVDGATITLSNIETVNILAGGGNDNVTGNELNNSINGAAGNDIIRTGQGTDTANGGTGDDLFIFAVGDGSDLIGDFTAGAGTDDVIDISAFGFTTFDAVGPGEVRLVDFMTDNGTNTTIDLDQAPGGDQLQLLNVVVADLDSSDFIL
ncbi:MAG: calcium-binding protein [Pseudomonadota bacterium]